MNWTPLYIIPGLTFLFWAVVHSLLASRTRDYPILFLLMMAVFLTAAGDVIVGTVFGSTTVAHLIVQLTAPAIIPITCLYFARMWRDEVKINAIHVLWLSIPVVMFTASAMLAGINGLENTDAFLARIHDGGSAADVALNRAESAFYLWTVVIFRLVMGIEAIFMLAYCIFLGIKFRFRPRNLYNYLSNRRWRIRVLEVQVSISLVILVGLCIKIYLHHPAGHVTPFLIVLLLLLSVMQFLFGYFALFETNTFRDRTKEAMVRDGVGFSINLKPTFQTGRFDLRIHPDGNQPGTEGCIGLTGNASTLRDFVKIMRPLYEKNNTINLSVKIKDNPNYGGM